MNSVLNHLAAFDIDPQASPRIDFGTALSQLAKWSSIAIIVLWLVAPLLIWVVPIRNAAAAEESLTSAMQVISHASRSNATILISPDGPSTPNV